MSYSITFPLRLIGRNAGHSLNTVSAFALIIAIIISTFGIIDGFSGSISGLIVQAGYSNRFTITPKDPENTISNSTLARIYQEKLGHILPLVKMRTLFWTQNKSLQTDLVGTNITGLNKIFLNMKLFNGELPEKNKSTVECIKGIEVQSLGKNETVNINISENFIGTFYVTGTLSGIAELQQAYIVHLEDYATLVNESFHSLTYNEIKIRTSESFTQQEIEQKLTEILGKELIIWNEQQADVFADKLREDLYEKLILFFIILLIIALVRLFHGISWFVIEYERTLLIMRAIGMSRERLFIMIIMLGQIIGNLGFIFGGIIGYAVPPIILALMTGTSGVDFLVTEYPLVSLIPLWLTSVLIIMIAGIFSSVRIVKTPPSKISVLIMEM